MPTVVSQLFPTNTDGQAFNPTTLYSANASGVVYKVEGYSSIVVQLDIPVDAAFAGTITLQISLDGNTFYDFPSGAVTYTSAGLKPALNVEGIRFVRLQFTTTSGTVEVLVNMTGVQYA